MITSKGCSKRYFISIDKVQERFKTVSTPAPLVFSEAFLVTRLQFCASAMLVLFLGIRDLLSTEPFYYLLPSVSLTRLQSASDYMINLLNPECFKTGCILDLM